MSENKMLNWVLGLGGGGSPINMELKVVVAFLE